MQKVQSKWVQHFQYLQGKILQHRPSTRGSMIAGSNYSQEGQELIAHKTMHKVPVQVFK